MKRLAFLLFLFSGTAHAYDPIAGFIPAGDSIPAAAAGGGGGTLLVGDNREATSGSSIGGGVLGYTWDGGLDGGGAEGYTAAASGTVAKAVIGLEADATPANNGKVCVADSSKNIIGCCSGPIGSSSAGDYEFTTCDSITITSGNQYHLGFIPDSATQNIRVTATGTFKIDTCNTGSYASPPDPFCATGNNNTGWPHIYVTD